MRNILSLVTVFTTVALLAVTAVSFVDTIESDGASLIEVTYHSEVEEDSITKTVTGIPGGTIVVLAPETYEGYDFVGWRASDGTLYQAGDLLFVGDQPIDLEAEWEGYVIKIDCVYTDDPVVSEEHQSMEMITLAIIVICGLVVLLVVQYTRSKVHSI